MIKLEHLLFSKQVIVDEVSKHASIINLMDEISAPKFPAILNESFICTLFSRNIEKDKSIYKVEFTASVNKTPIGGAKIDLDFSNKKRNRCIIKFPPIPIKESGILNISVMVDGKKMGSIDVDITHKPVKEPSSK